MEKFDVCVTTWNIILQRRHEKTAADIFQGLVISQAPLASAVCFNLQPSPEKERKHCLSSLFSGNQYLDNMDEL